MAISYGSELPDEDRVFTVAIDWHEKGAVKGVLYPGGRSKGVCFTGYQELARMVEEYFVQIRYPHPVMDQRELRLKESIWSFEEEEKRIARRRGNISSYVIRVTQRQNASWQGGVIKENGEVFCFFSFLDLIECLETDLGSPAKAAICGKEGQQQRVEQYLEMVMGYPKTERIEADILEYYFQSDGKSRRFIVWFLYYENHTCQGIVYWREGRRQVSFRSFLELIRMMGDAIPDRNIKEESEDSL